MLIVDAEFYSFHCPQPKDVSFFGLKIISPDKNSVSLKKNLPTEDQNHKNQWNPFVSFTAKYQSSGVKVKDGQILCFHMNIQSGSSSSMANKQVQGRV